MHHRRHSSLDSHVFSTPLQPPQSYTLQGGLSARPAFRLPVKMTAHAPSSPLITATTIASVSSPPPGSLENFEMDAEMERMVSSVVNSPVDSSLQSLVSPPLSAISSLGLVLPGPLQSQQTQAKKTLSTAATRSLLGSLTDNPKANMSTRAAFGNYRNKILSNQNLPVPAPEVKVSLPSPTQPPFTENRPSEIDEARQSGLLSPPEASKPQAPKTDTFTGAGTTRTRRSASVGTLPSLDQICDWSLRRHGVSNDATSMGTDMQHPLQRSMTPPPGLGNALVPPVIQILGATPPRPLIEAEEMSAQLMVILQGTRRASRKQQAISMPSSPVKENFCPNALPLHEYRDRTHRAKQMVSVLERRKSLSMIR